MRVDECVRVYLDPLTGGDFSADSWVFFRECIEKMNGIFTSGARLLHSSLYKRFSFVRKI